MYVPKCMSSILRRYHFIRLTPTDSLGQPRDHYARGLAVRRRNEEKRDSVSLCGFSGFLSSLISKRGTFRGESFQYGLDGIRLLVLHPGFTCRQIIAMPVKVGNPLFSFQGYDPKKPPREI